MPTGQDLTLESTIDLVLKDFTTQSVRVQSQLTKLANRMRLYTEPPEKLQFQLAKALEERDHVIELDAAADGMFAELADVGVRVDRVDRLRTLPAKETKIEPVLLRWLVLTDSRPLKLAIIRALDARWATSASAVVLIDLFWNGPWTDDADRSEFRWAIVATLRRVAERSFASDLFRIANDPESGTARVLAIATFKKFRAKVGEFVPQLMSYLGSSDRELSVPAAEVLATWRIAEAKPRIRELLDEAKAEQLAGEGSWSQLESLARAAKKFDVAPR